MIDWHVQHLRVTLFSDQPKAIGDSSNLFRTLTGADEDIDERRGAGGVFHRRAGVVDGRRYELTEQPGRVDFAILSSIDLQISALGGTLDGARLCLLNEADATLSAPAELLMSRAEKVIRIAIGGLLFTERASREEAYVVLQQLIPQLNVDPVTLSDFQLQGNRFRPLRAIPALNLNRLGLWQAMMTFVPVNQAAVPYSHWAQQVLDVSTDAANANSFTPEQLKAIWMELKDAFMELSQGFK